jgi:hypothetical protein
LSSGNSETEGFATFLGGGSSTTTASVDLRFFDSSWPAADADTDDGRGNDAAGVDTRNSDGLDATTIGGETVDTGDDAAAAGTGVIDVSAVITGAGDDSSVTSYTRRTKSTQGGKNKDVSTIIYRCQQESGMDQTLRTICTVQKTTQHRKRTTQETTERQDRNRERDSTETRERENRTEQHKTTAQRQERGRTEQNNTRRQHRDNTKKKTTAQRGQRHRTETEGQRENMTITKSSTKAV